VEVSASETFLAKFKQQRNLKKEVVLRLCLINSQFVCPTEDVLASFKMLQKGQRQGEKWPK
jgi:hypothetical protein